jgi:hypothetical protein
LGVSFQRAATFTREAGKILKSLSNAPKAVIRGVVQAEKATFAQAAIFWGLAASGGLCSVEFQDQAAVRS